MKVKFLGTAAAEGWPGLFCQCSACRKARLEKGKNIRTRSSCIVEDEYMIDFPPDTYMHVLKENVDLSRICYLIITHSHQDHFYTDDLLMRNEPFAHIDNIQILNVYGNDKVKEKIEKLIHVYGTTDMMKYHEVHPFEPFEAGQALVTPLLANHDRNERCYIYLIELNGKKLLYGHDTGYFLENTWKFLKHHYLNGVILDCTLGTYADGKHHMGIPDNVEVKERLLRSGSTNDSTQFIITHFSHNGGLLHQQLVEVGVQCGFYVAYDGAKIFV